MCRNKKKIDIIYYDYKYLVILNRKIGGKNIKKLLLGILLFASIFLGMQKCDVMASDEGTYQGDGYTLTYVVTGTSCSITDCNTSAESIIIPDEIGEYEVTSIGGYAFYHCTSLKRLTIPKSVTIIGKNAFGFYTDESISATLPISGFIAYVESGSVAQKYCNTNNIPCEVPGIHTYGAWKTTKSATVFSTGISTRTCTVCKKTQTKSIAKLTPTIKLSKTKLTLKKKKSSTIKVYTLAKGDSVKSWKTSNKKVATVTQKGKITAKKKGKATITVTLKSGKKATVKVTVK